MSTLKATYLQHPSAGSPNITLASTGAVALNGTVTGGGMDLITTQTFGAVSSVSFNNCFSATYENYRIVITISNPTGSGNLNSRLRVGGVDNSASTYNLNGIVADSGTVSGFYVTNTSSWQMVRLYTSPSGSIYQLSFDICKPFAVTETSGNIVASGYSSAGPSGMGGGFYHNTAASFDGITFYPASGNFTGTVRVYGYKN